MRIVRLVACLAAVALQSTAQSPSAQVVGRVTDSSGAVIPGVVVRVTNLDTNISQQASSNGAGDFAVPYLNPGRYSMEVQADGFREYKRAEFELAVDQVLRLDVPLEVGAATERVTVNEAPPLLNTESGARGAVITKEEISEIPLDSRNFSDLAYLTGGVIPKGDGGDGSYAINGARADNVGFLIDGMNNTQRRNSGAVINPPLEGVQEFKMITSGFSAEYGRYAGGVLSAVTKSGSNKLHGSLYEFIRNDIWDAVGYFDVEKSKLRSNRFGSTVTGPVLLPKMYNGRNRTFFLFTWESLRVVDGKTQRGIVPLPEMLKGDFSKATDAFGKPIKLTDPLSKAPFPNNQIPLSRLDPVALKLAAFYPQPNLTGVNNYIAQGNGTTSNDNFGIKVDHQLTAKDRLTFSTFWRPNATYDPVVSGRSPIPLFGLGNNTLDLLSYVRYLRMVTPTFFVELNASFSRKTNNQLWPAAGERDWAGDAGFLGGTRNPVAQGLPQLDASGYITLGPAYDYPKIWSFNNYEYSGSSTWIHGPHTVKFGADFLRMQYFSRQYGDTRGRMTFLGRFTGEPMADLLLGYAQTSRRQLDGAGPYHLVSNYSGYVQDDFKVRPGLTLNLGLRYELMKPPREKFGAWSMFVPSLGKIVIAGKGTLTDFDKRIQDSGLSQYITMAADAGLPETIRKTNYLDLAPRFGFAWRPFGGTTSVIRGGYGIFYGSSSLYRMDEYSDTYPFSINESYSATSSNPLLLTVSNPFPVAKRSVGGVTGTSGQEASGKDQYLQSWSLTVEREFRHSTVLEIGYAGSKGTHLQRRYDINQQVRDLSIRQATGSFPRPYPAFSTINIINDGSNSSYGSGSVTVRRRFSKQLSLRASYTYAKSIDESSNTGGTIAYNFPIAQDSRNLKGERGRSDFDIGHSFAASFIWQMNFTRNLLLRNWQMAGTSTIYTGPPFTPKVANFNFTNGEASRPNRIGKGTLPDASVDQWFDRTAFPVVPVGSFLFGNSGRNILDGPGTVNVNMSVSRRFRFGETEALQFRVESFNLPNHPNFNLPENRVDIISGGTISRAKNTRLFQLGLRLEF
jgi:hypothetical protein